MQLEQHPTIYCVFRVYGNSIRFLAACATEASATKYCEENKAFNESDRVFPSRTVAALLDRKSLVIERIVLL